MNRHLKWILLRIHSHDVFTILASVFPRRKKRSQIDTHGKTCTHPLLQSHEKKKQPMTYDILCPMHTTEESLTRRGGLFLDLTRRPLNQISFRNLETPSCSWGASPSSRKIQCCSMNIPARIIFLILPPLVGVNHRQIQF